MKILLICVLICIGVTSGKDWWENGNFYQIYPRSFKDSDGDGIGDLNGVTDKLQYLKDIGMTGVWLSPIFQSPMADFGYDISDYYKIHHEYGTMADFENMIRKAKELDIKIILDFVPNHTSDENDWFKKSVKREGNYENYYVWHDGIDDGVERKPPNNWISVFRYSAWEYNEERDQFYLHQFATKQPDLNYRDENVVAEMKAVLRFWLAKGVSGFRIDAVPFLFEVQTLADEEVDDACPDPDDYCHVKHVNCIDQPETYDMIYQWRELLDEFEKENGGGTRIIMTEAYTSLPKTLEFYGDGTRNGSQVPFNFELISHTNKDSSANDYSNAIDSWLKNMPEGVYPNWVLGNHDNKRLASRYGENRADIFNILLQTLPGIAVTYNGEEIAMTDVYISWEETVDPQACNTNEDVFNSFSRDPARTPFQWDSSKNAGFSKGPTTWLPVSDTYKKNNVALQLQAPFSHLHIFKKLVKLRQEPSFQDLNSMEKHVTGDNILVYKRETPGSDAYIIMLNFGKKQQTINLKSIFPTITNKLEVITTSLQSGYIDGVSVPSTAAVAYAEVGTVFAVVK